MGTNIFNPADVRRYPSRWPLYRGKGLFRVIDERSASGDEELLSVSHLTGITPRSQKNVTMFQSESLIGYKICQIGDIVANTMWTWQGAIGVSDYAGVVSPAYNVYRQKDDSYHPKYLDMLLREPKLVDVYHSLSTGIRPSRLRLYPEVFLTIDFPVPPRAEQEKIVRFLEWKASEINKLIGIHRKEIQKLEELKSCIIDKFVIHGLHGDFETHNDDTRWEIDYPSNWKIERLRNLFAFRKGLSITKANLELTGIPVINYGQVHSKKNNMVGLNNELFRYVNPSYLITDPSALVQKGDFIFADTSEDLDGSGNCAYIDRDEKIFAGYHSVIAHAKDGTDNKYFAYLFKSSTWRYQIWKKVNAVKVYSITQQILKDTFLLVPSREEQQEIVHYLDSVCSKIDLLIADAHKDIVDLIEMKSVVVSDVVTGKIDVRNVMIPEYEHVDDVADDDLDNDDEAAEAGEEEG